MTAPLLCKDCRHFRPTSPSCAAPDNIGPEVPDYVNGGTKRNAPRWYGAQYCRQDTNACGPDGAWFEEKVRAEYCRKKGCPCADGCPDGCYLLDEWQ